MGASVKNFQLVSPDDQDKIILQFGSCIWHGSVGASDSHNWCIKIVEGWTLGYAGGDLSSHPVLRPASLNGDCMAGFLNRLIHCVHVQGADGAKVDHLNADALLGKQLSGIHSKTNANAVSNQGDVSAGSLDLGLANGQDKVGLHDGVLHVEGCSVQQLILKENNRVRVYDSCLQQAFAVLRIIG